MKRGYIRSIWGDIHHHRDGKIEKELLKTKDRDWFTVFTFGSDNHSWLLKEGFNSELVNQNCRIWDLQTEMYRHKLEVFLKASEIFDEFVFLDWDCVPTGNIQNSWNELGKKESFQANLFQYRTKKCIWRDGDQRKVCNGGFAYFRDKSIPKQMIQIWDELHSWVEDKKIERQEKGLDIRFREKSLIFDDEPSMSKYIDNFCGKWCGVDKYWELFEPEVCNLRKKSAYPDYMIKNKKSCFIHNL